MIKRLFPTRWAGILAWTGAAVAWSVSLFAVAQDQTAEAQTSEVEPATRQQVQTTTTFAPVPDLPETGLVVIRYTPVPPPPPQEIVRTVTVAVPAKAQVSSPAVKTSPKTKVKSKGS